MFREEDKVYGTIAAARKIGIELHRLYSWERHGVVRPMLMDFCTRKFRRYSPLDIERAAYIKQLVDNEGYTLIAAVRKLKKEKE